MASTRDLSLSLPRNAQSGLIETRIFKLPEFGSDKNLSVTFERLSADEVRTLIDCRGHYHVGDCHIGQKSFIGNHDQLLAYARGAGITEFVMMVGGDFIYPRQTRKADAD